MKVYETGSTEVAATRKNDYFFRDWDPDPASKASDYPEINVKEGTTVTSKGKAWIPGMSETPITYDAQGNVTGLIDISGNLDAAYEYDPYGKLISYAGARRASMSLLHGTK